ncbi:T9SS type A sorting domain-containing protein [Ferruginibacter lapsinanis]|uniref:LamG-like jellyroll fold domain-containing protein n=1 Tax=Ferruginibacter lapsinanis TaxID=563172 RepID=UPI001E46B831|nr:LamG-like jellyroll fold domain-containing protein [Ferruginibacter lapsinanis]UEG48987.1 T9SS type A sorting domain-containing protein [Ferruginibacter lapsinanis]
MKLKLLLLAALISQLCFAQANLTLGLQAYYPFSGNANDVSGNNNNPVFNNATLTDDRLGNVKSAYNFNGSDQYMRILNSPSLNTGNQLSLCVWIKPKGFFQGLCHGNAIIAKDDDKPAGFYYLGYGDGLYTGVNCSSSFVDEAHENFYGRASASHSGGYTPYIETEKWYSVVYTYDGTKTRLYVNCNIIDSVTTSLNFTNSLDLYFGKLNTSFFYWLNADLDEVRIYNRALNQTEINLYGDCAIAPVILSDFSIKTTNNQSATLNWNVSQETNIKEYVIERSVNGTDNFIPVGNITAVNSAIEKTYSFDDKDLLSDTYYYRIIINEKNGIRKYSEIRKVVIINKGFNATVYPNASNGSFTVRINKDAADVTVVNATGQTVLNKKIKNSMTAPLNISSQPNGIYWIKIISNNNIITKRIVKF